MADSSTRIVSLIPSATEILAALGLTPKLVGISHECDYPQEIENFPVCTTARLNSDAPSDEIHREVTNLVESALSIYQIKIDVLEKLQPTHILTQDQCEVCAVSFGEVEKALKQLTHSCVEIISLQPNILEDVWKDIEKVAKVFNLDSTNLLKNLTTRLENITKKLNGLSISQELPTVACIEWTQPLMIAANWIPELVSIAGGKSLLTQNGHASSTIEWQELITANPDIIIFMPCGFDLSRTRREAEKLTEVSQWKELKAVKNNRVYITDGNSYFNRPGPRLVDSTEILAEIIHPEIFAFGHKNRGWKSLS